MNIVRKLREEKGFKQEDIAEVLDNSVSTYSKKENGKLRFSLEDAIKLSIFFHKPIEVIFCGREVSKIET